MPLCFFIRRTADSNRIARMGSLLRVEGEGNRREIEMCAFSSYWVLFSGARYSAHIEIFPEHADTIMHAHCVRLCSLTPVHL